MRLATHRLSANNTSLASETKIHDHAVAKRFGFAGGLAARIGRIGVRASAEGGYMDEARHAGRRGGARDATRRPGMNFGETLTAALVKYSRQIHHFRRAFDGVRDRFLVAHIRL